MKRRFNLTIVGIGFLVVMFCSLRINLNPAVDGSYIVAMNSSQPGAVYYNDDNHGQIYKTGFVFNSLSYMRTHKLTLYKPQNGQYQSFDHILLSKELHHSRHYPSKAKLEVSQGKGQTIYTMRLSVDEVMVKRWAYRIDDSGVHNIREYTFYWMPFITTMLWWVSTTVLLLVFHRDRSKNQAMR